MTVSHLPRRRRTGQTWRRPSASHSTALRPRPDACALFVPPNTLANALGPLSCRAAQLIWVPSAQRTKGTRVNRNLRSAAAVRSIACRSTTRRTGWMGRVALETREVVAGFLAAWQPHFRFGLASAAEAGNAAKTKPATTVANRVVLINALSVDWLLRYPHRFLAQAKKPCGSHRRRACVEQNRSRTSCSGGHRRSDPANRVCRDRSCRRTHPRRTAVPCPSRLRSRPSASCC